MDTRSDTTTIDSMSNVGATSVVPTSLCCRRCSRIISSNPGGGGPILLLCIGFLSSSPHIIQAIMVMYHVLRCPYDHECDPKVFKAAGCIGATIQGARHRLAHHLMNPSCHTLTEKSAYEVASKCLITAVRGDNSTEIVQRESVNKLILGKEDSETKTKQTEDEDEDGPTFGSETKKRKRKRKKSPAKLEPAEGELEEQTEEGPTFNVGVKKRREELKELKTCGKVLKTIFHTSTSHHVSEIKKHLRLLEMNVLDSFFHKRRSKLLRKNLRHSNELRRRLRSRGWVVQHQHR